jgi:signal transduction histidine kinase/CheY-like chemotaxis protein
LSLQINIYSLFLILAATATGTLAYFLFKKEARASRLFGWLMTVLSIWAFAYGIELTSVNLERMLFWIRIEYIGISVIPAIWFMFCVSYSGHNNWLDTPRKILLFLIPVTTLILVWTNDWHYLYYSSVAVDDTSGPFPLLNFERGVWYWVHTVYFYLLLVWGTTLLLLNYRNSDPLFKRQTLFVFFGAFFPWMANIIYLLGYRPFGYLDITPFVFTLSGLIIGIGLLQFKLFEIIPVARDRIIEDLADGVMVLDSHDRIIYCNKQMLNILTEINQSPVGSNAADIFENFKLLLKLIEKRINSKVDLEINVAGSLRSFETSSTTLFESRSNYNGIILLFHDVSEQRITMSELVNARIKAEEADRLKTSFLANMSHEIRNPMNGIIGFAGLLRDESSSDEDRQRYAEIIENNAHHLLNIINDIIDISKIEAGQDRIKRDVISVTTLLNELGAFFYEQAKKKNLDLSFASAISESNDKIYTDPLKLRQILVNLIGNAVKFTHEGGITIRAKKVNQDLIFQITDTGIGIKDDEQVHIFDRFRQSYENNLMLNTGTGLGLSISKGYATLLGGTIEVKSKFGSGSTFILKIPHIIADATKTPKVVRKMQEAKIEMPDWSNKTILLAEDEPVNVMYIKIALKNTKVNLIVATTGLEAIDEFKKADKVDLVLMDIKMPEMDGFEASENIKKINNETPIIALSGHAMVEQERLDKAGFTALISKPVRKDDLINNLKKWL